MIVDAADQIVGRMASFVAKKAMLGESIDIINCDKAVITGDKKRVLESFKRRRNFGVPLQGPYFPRKPERIVKRMIRGMLPYKQEKGRKAFERIMCYSGVPDKLKDGKAEKAPGADVSKVTRARHIKIIEISKELGAKV